MDFTSILTNDSWWFTWILLPLLIFTARIADQSFGTLRLIFVSKGFKNLAPVVGFFESVIWLLAISQIMKHIDNAACIIAYGSGFGMGNYVGMILEEKISIGKVLIRIVPKHNCDELVEALYAKDIGLTTVDATGRFGPVKVVYSIINRKDLTDIINLIDQHNPNAFYSIEEVKQVQEGVFRQNKRKRVLRASFGPKKTK